MNTKAKKFRNAIEKLGAENLKTTTSGLVTTFDFKLNGKDLKAQHNDGTWKREYWVQGKEFYTLHDAIKHLKEVA